MKESFLKSIEKASAAGSIQSASIILSARGVSYQITNADPNVIRYWVTRFGIAGRIVF
jgi:hypothetical protein